MNKLVKNYYQIVFVFLTLLLFSSCLKEEDSLRLSIEKEEIEDYLNNKGKNITPTSSGLYFEQVKEGKGSSPILNDFVLINFRETTLDGRVLDTSNKAEADSNNIIAPSSYIDGPLKLYMNGIRIKGLIEGILLMKEGGRAWMLMPSSLTFNDYIPRIFEVELIKVISDPVAYENEKISHFLDTIKLINTNNRPNIRDTTSDGIYYIETLTGSGNNPVPGNTVTINFSSKLIDGQAIYNNTTYTFNVDDSNIIPGLSAGIKKMKKGGKAVLVIPYNKAFGVEGIIENNIILIPMYSTLVYDVELKSLISM